MGQIEKNCVEPEVRGGQSGTCVGGRVLLLTHMVKEGVWGDPESPRGERLRLYSYRATSREEAWTCWPGMDHRELVSLELDDGWEGVEAEVRQPKTLKEG